MGIIVAVSSPYGRKLGSQNIINIAQDSKCMLCKQPPQFELLYNRQTSMPLPFTPFEVVELRDNFNQLAKGQPILDPITFRENMGVLGLHTAEMLADRVFCSFDMDGDGLISFYDFAEYIDILRYGSPMEKALISFRMIDIRRQGYFSDKDFKEFMIDFLRSWSVITNSPITNEVLTRTNLYIKKMFEQRSVTSDRGRIIDFNYYFKNIYKDNQLILAFDWMTQGVSNQFIKQQTQNEVRLERQIVRIADQLDNIYSDMYPLFPKQSEIVLTQQGFPILIGQPSQLEPTTQSATLDALPGKTVKERFRQLVEQIGGVKRHIQAEYMKNMTVEQDIKRRATTAANVHRQLANNEGKMLFIGDSNWNLILNMMIGLQMAVRSVKSYDEMVNEEPLDFGLKYYFELIPRRFGGDRYLNKVQICKFTDYAPNTFNHIRKIFKIDNDQYIKSIGPDKVLTSLLVGQVSSMAQLMSQGKSGSFFYYSADGQYMLKTITRREFVFLRSILFDYYHYLSKNPHSFITKFFGLHKLVERGPNGENIRAHYFVIMANIFNTQEKIVERYDLKGSFLGRFTEEVDLTATKKDVNFLQRNPFFIHPTDKDQILGLLQEDLNFLCSHGIVDYSLLVGVIVKTPNQNLAQMNITGVTPRIYDSVVNDERYTLGLIDILTRYGFRKKAEYCFKSCICGMTVSIVPPVPYAFRMLEFVKDRVVRSSL